MRITADVVGREQDIPNMVVLGPIHILKDISICNSVEGVENWERKGLGAVGGENGQQRRDNGTR